MENVRRLLILAGVIGLVVAAILAVTSAGETTFGDDCGSVLARKSVPRLSDTAAGYFREALDDIHCHDAIARRRSNVVLFGALGLAGVVAGILDWSRFGHPRPVDPDNLGPTM